MNQERIPAISKQEVNSAQAIFNQARALYEVTPPEGKDRFISRDSRLPEALSILDLPSGLVEAITTVKKREEEAREKAKADRASMWSKRWG